MFCVLCSVFCVVFLETVADAPCSAACFLFSWATSEGKGQATFRDAERHRGDPCKWWFARGRRGSNSGLAWPSPRPRLALALPSPCPRLALASPSSCPRHSSLVTRHSSLSRVVVVQYIRGERVCECIRVCVCVSCVYIQVDGIIWLAVPPPRLAVCAKCYTG